MSVGSLDIDLRLDTAGMAAALQASQQRLAEVGREASRQMRIVRAEFGEASASIDDNADSVDQLQIRQRYLGQRLEQQRTVVDALTDTYNRSRAATGENSEETRRLELRLARAREEQARTEQQIRQTTRRIEEQSDETQRAGRNWGELSQRIQGAGEKLTAFASIAIGGFVALATEGTKELRKELAILETNAQMAGSSVEAVNEMYREMNSIIDDLGANTEGLSNLMAAGFDDTQMQQAMENIIGASIKFKETLKFEGIADGLQETLATGAAIGSFGELLERLGVNLDEFNAGLTEAIANGTEHQYVLDVMAKQGLTDVYELYKKNNEELIRNQQAIYDVQVSMAELGKTLEPVITRITELLGGLVDGFNKLPGPAQNAILALGGFLFVLGPILLVISQLIAFIPIVTAFFVRLAATSLVGALMTGLRLIALIVVSLTSVALPALGAAFSAVMTFILTPIGLVVAALVGLAALAYVVIRNWEPIKEFFVTLWEGVKLVYTNVVEAMKAPFRNFVNFVISGINAIIAGLNRIKITVPDWVPNIGGKSWGVNIASVPELHDGGVYRAPMGQTEGLALLQDGETVTPRGLGQVIQHTGTIRVEGVSDRGQLMGIVDIVMDQLRQEVRV